MLEFVQLKLRFYYNSSCTPVPVIISIFCLQGFSSEDGVGPVGESSLCDSLSQPGS